MHQYPRCESIKTGLAPVKATEFAVEMKVRVGTKTYRELREKSKLVNWHNDERKEYFALFSKAGFTPELRKEDALLFDLKGLEH